VKDLFEAVPEITRFQQGANTPLWMTYEGEIEGVAGGKTASGVPAIS
jgi:hypothetical protein